MDRPHIRFIGETGLEDPKWYNHKQNDALGYFMWARTQLAWHKKLPFNGEHLKLMGQLFDYLRAIESWADLDGGHWEEHSAIHASSIGPPLAAVKLFTKVAARDGFLPPCKSDTLEVLEKNLQAALLKILPGEITFPAELARDADAAAVFLAYPLEVVDDQLGLQIMERLTKVMGHIGIRCSGGSLPVSWAGRPATFMVHLPPLGRSEDEKAVGPVSPKSFSNVIEAIGFGIPQLIVAALCGFIWAADGAELLLLGCWASNPALYVFFPQSRCV
eukprot:g2125.t1